jgi:hypothetical protein
MRLRLGAAPGMIGGPGDPRPQSSDVLTRPMILRRLPPHHGEQETAHHPPRTFFLIPNAEFTTPTSLRPAGSKGLTRQ